MGRAQEESFLELKKLITFVSEYSNLEEKNSESYSIY